VPLEELLLDEDVEPPELEEELEDEEELDDEDDDELLELDEELEDDPPEELEDELDDEEDEGEGLGWKPESMPLARLVLTTLLKVVAKLVSRVLDTKVPAAAWVLRVVVAAVRLVPVGMVLASAVKKAPYFSALPEPVSLKSDAGRPTMSTPKTTGLANGSRSLRVRPNCDKT